MVNQNFRIFAYSSYSSVCRFTLHYRYIIYYSVPPLIWFMMNGKIKKHLNIFLWFSDDVTPLTLKNNLRIILDSKPEKFKNIDARNNVKVCTFMFVECHQEISSENIVACRSGNSNKNEKCRRN